MFVTLGECCFERRIYPGFDELSFKAPTQLTFVAPTKYTVTSNTPIISESTTGGLTTRKFAPTQSIVAYLVAFSVFEKFSTVSTLSGRGINVTAWGRSDIADQIVDSASYGAALLDFYSEYFGIDFPYPKMDFILMPDQVRHDLLAAL
jgi:aminopeptidase N